MSLFIFAIATVVVLCIGVWFVSLRPLVRLARLPRRLLAYSALPLIVVGFIFVVRFWHPTAGPFAANLRYPFGSHLNAWAVSFGYAWIAFGVLYAAFSLAAPAEPSPAVLTALLVTWAVTWLPHGVIGLAVALDGMTSHSVTQYESWASRPLGAIVLAADALLLVSHFGLSVAGFLLEGAAVRHRRATDVRFQRSRDR